MTDNTPKYALYPQEKGLAPDLLGMPVLIQVKRKTQGSLKPFAQLAGRLLSYSYGYLDHTGREQEDFTEVTVVIEGLGSVNYRLDIYQLEINRVQYLDKWSPPV